MRAGIMRATLVAALSPLALATPALAQSDDAQAGTYRFVEHYVVDPSKAKTWDASWKSILREADRQDYPMPMYGYQHRNHRWLVTPMDAYADIDAMLDARDGVYAEGGKTFADSVDAMMGSVVSNRSYILRHDPELSYHPEDWQPQPYSRVDTYYYRPDKADAIRELARDYRDMVAGLEEPRGFDVYWTAVGSERPGMTFISSAESPLALAQHQSETSARRKPEAKRLAKLMERLQAIIVDTETLEATLKPDLSYRVDGIDWAGSN